MSSEVIVGTISAAHCLSREVVWEVQRFSHLPKGGFACCTSFMFQGQEWKVGLRPNYRPERIRTYLMRKGPPVVCPDQRWKFHLGLKRHRDGVEQIVESKPIRMESDGFESWACSVVSQQLTRSLLEEETDAFCPGGSLFIFARISVEGLPSLREATTQTEEIGEVTADKIFFDEDFKSGSCDESEVELIPSVKVLTSLSKDLKNLYHSETGSDTTIKVGDTIFRVHKSILEARAPGITNMLSHNSVEACDPEAFSIFLKFVYSGDLENLTIDNVFEVYGIAGKFNQSKLKDICARFMLFNLDVDTVCEVLKTAMNNGESELQERATEFLFENAEEVFALPEWEIFMIENPTQAQNLIIGSLKYARRGKDSSESV